MENMFARAAGEPNGNGQVPQYLAAEKHRESKVWDWWYYLAAPIEPGSSASFKAMEHFRRGRTGSQIIFALYVLLIISIPAQFVGTNIYLLPIVAGTAFLLVIATVFNRLGMVNVAGPIVVLSFIAFPIVNMVTTPGGLSMLILPLFGLFILPLLCAVSFLPPWWVFIVALGNCAFTFYSLLYLPRTAELIAILNIAFAGIITPIILSQLIISVVAYAWVQSTSQALIRADRAEELAKLEHDLALQAEIAAQQKNKLESSIQKIMETHLRVANGDYNARVPLTNDNVLWQVSGSLNNLLVRLQRQRQDIMQFEQMKYALQQAREENRMLRRNLNIFPTSGDSWSN